MTATSGRSSWDCAASKPRWRHDCHSPSPRRTFACSPRTPPTLSTRLTLTARSSGSRPRSTKFSAGYPTTWSARERWTSWLSTTSPIWSSVTSTCSRGRKLGVPSFACARRTAIFAGWPCGPSRRADASDRVVGSVVALRDCQSEVAAQRAASTLSAGSQVLVRSENEADLLVQMCQAAVDEGGYALAWYGASRRRARAASPRSRRAASTPTTWTTIKVNWSTGPSGRGPTGTAIRTGEPVVINDLARK